MKGLFLYFTVISCVLTIVFAYYNMLTAAGIFLSTTVTCGATTIILSELEIIKNKLGITAPEEKKLEEK